MSKVSYFINHVTSPDGQYRTRTLIELTAKEFAAHEDSATNTLQPVHFTRAHQIVRDGYMIHSTALWFDGERVRRAQPGN